MQSITSEAISKEFVAVDNKYFNGQVFKKLQPNKLVLVPRNNGPCEMIVSGHEPKVIKLVFNYSHGNKHLEDTVKHQMLHLIMYLWGYGPKEKDIGTVGILEYHGKLFNCLMRKFYGRRHIFVGSYSNFDESCYMDCLLVLFFLSDVDLFRDVMIYSEPGTDINLYDPTTCDFDSKLTDKDDKKTQKKLVEYAKNLHKLLREDYENILSGSTLKCVDIRKFLFTCITRMKRYGEYISYSVSDAYVLYTQLFPKLKIQGLPAFKLEDNYIFDSSINGISYIPMWDFMTEIEDNGVYIDWQKTAQGDDVKYLAFSNTMSPPIKYYNNLDDEQIISKGQEITIRKERCFDMIILDKYKLRAIIMHNGRRPEFGDVEVDGHYTLYFMMDNEWYYYDDLSSNNRIRYIDRPLLSDILIDNGNQRPQMLFYSD